MIERAIGLITSFWFCSRRKIGRVSSIASITPFPSRVINAIEPNARCPQVGVRLLWCAKKPTVMVVHISRRA